MESLAYRCRPCGLTFRHYEELEKHYVDAHLDMTNEHTKKGQAHLILGSR